MAEAEHNPFAAPQKIANGGGRTDSSTIATATLISMAAIGAGIFTAMSFTPLGRWLGITSGKDVAGVISTGLILSAFFVSFCEDLHRAILRAEAMNLSAWATMWLTANIASLIINSALSLEDQLIFVAAWLIGSIVLFAISWLVNTVYLNAKSASTG